jgi:two-component system phosphate regulon sensor histidine kinase PhoR
MKRATVTGWTVAALAAVLGWIVVVTASIGQNARELRAERGALVEAVRAVATQAGPLFSLASPEADAEIRRWAAASGARVTLIRADGSVLADTWTMPELVGRLENHSGRAEVLAAHSQEVGVAARRSVTTDHDTTYAARMVGPPDRPLGFVRLAREDRRARWPWGGLLAVALAAGVAGIAARRAVAGAQRAVARHLAESVDTPATADVETFALEARQLIAEHRERREREVAALVTALDQASEGVLLLDAEQVVRVVNRAAATLLGEQIVVGSRLIEACRIPDLRALVTRSIKERLGGHTQIESRAGATLAVLASPLDHPTLACAVVIRDLTLEHSLERARRAFVADLAHELRTPLTVLGGVCEELAADGVDATSVARMARQVARLNAFSRDLEELAAIESESVRITHEPCDALTLARQAAGDLQANAAAAGVALSVEGAPAALATDPVRFGQVLTNVIDNAIRYNRPGGRVNVRVGTTERQVVIEVADTGLGIPAPEVPLVFQRLYRVRGAGRPEAGSGLGLAIVKHLVKTLGGTVHLRSEEGVGTTVTLLFPAAN